MYVVWKLTEAATMMYGCIFFGFSFGLLFMKMRDLKIKAEEKEEERIKKEEERQKELQIRQDYKNFCDEWFRGA